MTIVKIATKNLTKIKAINEVFNEYFGKVEIGTYIVESDVHEQPQNDEVFKGAENRINNLKEKLKIDNQYLYDYIVACEGGLINFYGKWFNVQVVTIENGDGKQSTGISQGYPIPERYIEQIINTSLADVLDELFDGKGGIRILTKNKRKREDLVKEATIMALTGLLNSNIW